MHGKVSRLRLHGMRVLLRYPQALRMVPAMRGWAASRIAKTNASGHNPPSQSYVRANMPGMRGAPWSQMRQHDFVGGKTSTLTGGFLGVAHSPTQSVYGALRQSLGRVVDCEGVPCLR